jgi:hypothetical protein
MTRPGSRRLARPGGFATRIGFNELAQIAPIVVSLALTPLLISRLGVDRFGIWSLARRRFRSSDPALQRFTQT